MSTIDFLYHSKIQNFEDRKKAAEKIVDANARAKVMREVQNEETEYLLSVGPILKEYLFTKDDASAPARSQSTDGVFGFVTVESSTQRGRCTSGTWQK